MSRKFVITIAREYCSGGKKIGKRLAEELGVSCYDSEMFQMVSTAKNLKEGIAEKSSGAEGAKLYEAARRELNGQDLDSFLANSEIRISNLFEYQSEIIRILAEGESCVIVGRAANYILKDQKDVVRIFIHAPLSFRLKRASSIHHMSEPELRSYLKKIDDKRADYYKHYTNQDWRDVSDYDLSIDVSRYGIQGCVDFIKKYIANVFGED